MDHVTCIFFYCESIQQAWKFMFERARPFSFWEQFEGAPRPGTGQIQLSFGPFKITKKINLGKVAKAGPLFKNFFKKTKTEK